MKELQMTLHNIYDKSAAKKIIMKRRVMKNNYEKLLIIDLVYSLA